MSLAANSRTRPLGYSASAKWLHWLIAIAVIALIPMGLVMKRVLDEGAPRDRLYDFHEALGAAVLLVMVARLARRLIAGAPAPDETLSPFERRASLSAQHALYLLLFIVPILGWLGTNAYGDPVSLFGLFTFPTLLGKDEPLSEQIFVWHLVGGLLVAAFVILHAGAALYHRLVKRDGVLARMWPGK
jgi:cytochrome b561